MLKTNVLGGSQVYGQDIIVHRDIGVRDLGSGPEYLAGQHRSDNAIYRQHTDNNYDAKHNHDSESKFHEFADSNDDKSEFHQSEFHQSEFGHAKHQHPKLRKSK